MAAGREQAALKDPAALLSIPVFPPIAIRLLQVISNDDVSLREVIGLLRADPAFSAEMLRRANSALFGLSAQVNTLQQALVVLGLRRVRGLTMTVASGMYLKAALKMEELRRCWRHTLACALLTEELAHVCSAHEDLAYTAGLMHDIGRLGLLVAHPAEYASFLRTAGEAAATAQNFDLLDYEQQVFGIHHCAAGQWLAQHWNLPQELHVITGRHHDRPMGGEMDLLTLVYLGCRLADGLGFDVVALRQPLTLEDIRTALPEFAQHRFHMDAAELAALIETKINALDIEMEQPLPPADEPGEADDTDEQETPAIWVPSRPRKSEPAPTGNVEISTFARDIAVAVLSSAAAAAVFFLLVRLFAR